MAGAVYTKQAFAGTVDTNPQDLYTVPDGYTFVLREVVAQNQAAASYTFALGVLDQSGSQLAALMQSADLPQYGIAQYSGRTAVLPGQKLRAYIGGTDWIVVITGYLLSGVAP